MIVWLIILGMNGINGLRDGAPKSACSTLMPRHPGTQAQTSQSPYEIRAELSDNKVLVRISSPVGEEIGGFVLQTRSSKDPSKFVDGTFTTSQLSKTVDCFGSIQNTLTHTNSNSKTEITTEWTPKENLNKEVIFKATVAKKYDTYWTEIDSNLLRIGDNSAISVEEELLYETCFRKEGCLGLPTSCVEQENCEVLLRYSQSSDGINFHLQGRLESSKYMAMALSEDDSMGEDSVTECIREGTSVIARESRNVGKSNTGTNELKEDSYTSSFVDGMTSCSWKLPLVYVANGRTYDFINENLYILLATGDITEWRLKYHSYRASSIEALNLTEYKVAGEVPDPDMNNSSSNSTDIGHPPTTPVHKMGSTTSKEENSSDKDETVVISSSRSSCLSICLVLLGTGLFFATKENMNMYF